MAKLFYEHVLAGAGFSGETFDIAAGGADLGIIDVLLSAGNGALTENAPHMLLSTGTLFAGGVTLSIAGMEVESVGGTQALNGRFFYLSVQNGNIGASNITVSGSGTINGAGTFVISSVGDYLFHHSSGGAWRVNYLPRPTEPHATIKRVSFASTVWDADVLNPNTIVITAATAPGLGEVGPHGLVAYSSYVVQVINTDMTPDEQVDVETQFDSSGNITLRKSPKGADFAGIAIIVGSIT